jgi:hypothetical protein
MASPKLGRKVAKTSEPPAPPAKQQPPLPTADSVRTSVVLPPEVYWNLSAWCVQHQLRKGDGIVELLSLGLKQHGLDPTKIPNVKIE